MPRYYLTAKDRRGLKKLVKDFGAGKGIPSRRPVPTRRRHVGGSGSGAIVALGTTTTAITAADDGYDPRVPGSGTVDVFAGTSSSTTWKNYSLVEIPTGTTVGAIEIGGEMVIWPAFC
jgi:hypothetical protein